jgi:AcrR family transcriptional regulator
MAADDSDVGPGRRLGLERADVVAAALDLVVREGAGALTMRRLATELDVGTPTIYWHVGSRDELVVEIIRSYSEQLAEWQVEGTSPRERVLAAALHLYNGALEHRAVTSLAHQTGTTSLLLHPLEEALVAELEASGLTGDACVAALRSILVVITGALVLTLRDLAQLPEDYRAEVLWAGSAAPIATDTRAALCAEPDLSVLTVATLQAVVDHHVPAPARTTRRSTNPKNGG